jgi:tetratricopeptide (TPR) repeat protein
MIHLGRTLHKIGDLSDALDCYNMAIDLNPDFGFAYFHRSSGMLSFRFRPFGCYDLQTAALLNVEGAKEAREKYCVMPQRTSF